MATLHSEYTHSVINILGNIHYRDFQTVIFQVSRGAEMCLKCERCAFSLTINNVHSKEKKITSWKRVFDPKTCRQSSLSMSILCFKVTSYDLSICLSLTMRGDHTNMNSLCSFCGHWALLRIIFVHWWTISKKDNCFVFTSNAHCHGLFTCSMCVFHVRKCIW